MRTIVGDIAGAVVLVLEVKLALDIEMVNMGDWSFEDYVAHAEPYEEAIEQIKQTKSLKGTDPRIIKEAVSCFKRCTEVFSNI